MDPNQQPNPSQDETPTTPAPEALNEAPQSSEAPVVTPVESVPVSDATTETPVETTPVSPSEISPETSPEVAPVTEPTSPTTPDATPASSADSTAAPVEPVSAPVSSPSTSTANPGFAFGLTSLILSLVSLGLFGVIFGILGLRKSKKAGLGNGLAIAGLIIGGIEVLFGILAVIFILIALPHLNFSE